MGPSIFTLAEPVKKQEKIFGYSKPKKQQVSDDWFLKAVDKDFRHSTSPNLVIPIIGFPLAKAEFIIEYNEVELESLPLAFLELGTAIEESKYILEYDDDWDEEGSEGYQADTWEKAIRFLCGFAKKIYEERDFIIETPDIDPGPNGSIDIVWRNDKFRLLINVPKEDKPATYYGDDFGINKSKGSFDIQNPTIGLCHILIS